MKFPDRYRRKDAPFGYESNAGDTFGFFIIPPRETMTGRQLKCMAVDGDETGWEHVSVSLPDYPKKCPSWDEMCCVKRLFWGDDETVIQFHPPASEYVNNHTGCLHLWRCVNQAMPIPPSILVGIKQLNPL